MKKLLVAVMLVAFAATSSLAADTVKYEAKNGTVTFNHKAHGEKNACKDCHKTDPPAKIEVNKEAAHGAVCKDCHKAKNGPTKCTDCHKK